MSRSTIGLSAALSDYIRATGVREHPALSALRARTAGMRHGGMQISPEQGQLMQLLVHMLGARRCLEVGTFTGYSALAVALALPADGKVIACDINADWTAVGRAAWDGAGVGHKVELRLGPAVATLDALLAAGGAGTFDFAFLDADKTGYDSYYERSLTLLRKGGLVAIDNVLWSGAVVDLADRDADTVALRRLNEKIHADARVLPCLVPIGDGLTLALKL